MSESLPPGRSGAGVRRIAGLAALLIGTVIIASIAWRSFHRAAPPTESSDPWAEFTSPYSNTWPGVRYVGDAVCADCHQVQADSYRGHPMGRALTPIDSSVAAQSQEADTFDALGVHFRIERRGGKVFHRAFVSDADGRVAAEWERGIQYIIGSGTRTHSFLVNQNGFLFESPITWYSHKGIWDLSPGFSRKYVAGRPVRAPCLFCHCNHAEHQEGTENGYRPPYFTGHAIGCERCHGPGELHAALRAEGGDAPPGGDDTIVNPGRLEPVLRDAVCQQCHLEGSNRIQRRGTNLYAYRPGLPLHRYLSIFVPSPEFGRTAEFVGQAEQMAQSRCYLRSSGKLGCISCHDPHARPAPDDRVRFFRDRCLKCHSDESCRLPLAERRSAEADSCIHCHMPRGAAHDLPHTAVTDHRILRGAGQVELDRPSDPAVAGMPLLYFFRHLVDNSDPEVARDRGIALMELAWEAPELKQHACALALPLLGDAVKRWPDDIWAWEAKGNVLWLDGRRQDALTDIERALALAPREERLLEAAGAMATSLGLNAKAKEYWERALVVNPGRALFHASLAEVLARQNNWAQVEKACQSALALDPFDIGARMLFVRSHLRAGNNELARVELRVLLALQPGRADELQRWFAQQAR
jgi:Flp pilus assembly protein TadD